MTYDRRYVCWFLAVSLIHYNQYVWFDSSILSLRTTYSIITPICLKNETINCQMLTCPCTWPGVWSNLNDSPKSAMHAVMSSLRSTFLLLKSRCATAGPLSSASCRNSNPRAMPCEMLTSSVQVTRLPLRWSYSEPRSWKSVMSQSWCGTCWFCWPPSAGLCSSAPRKRRMFSWWLI